MADPNDFVDKNTPEGNSKAGQEGVCGLSIEKAEKAYKAAANQHFRDQTAT